VPKTNGYRGWYIPEDATVEVDGEVVPVPVFTESVRNNIIAYSQQPDKGIPFMLGVWIKRRSSVELQALRHYFLDRWTWDTGCDYDKRSYMVAEYTIEQRSKTLAQLASLPPMNLEADFAELRRTGDIINAQIKAAMKVPSELL